MSQECTPSKRRVVVRKKVLFICSRNAARSQMAEGYLRTQFGDRYEAYSAGSNPSTVSGYAIQVMREIGIDISGQQSKSLEEFNGKEMDLVVTMCDTAAIVCPFFPWAKETVHMVFPDPHAFKGTEEEIFARFRSIRDQITQWIDATLGGRP